VTVVSKPELLEDDAIDELLVESGMDAVVRSVIDESDGRSVDVVELLAELSVLKTSELVEVVLGP
jgi:hypothetical protein